MVLQRLDMNVVAVMVVEEKHAFLAGAGRLDEAAGGIREYLAGDGLVVSIDVVGTKA